LVDYVVLGRHHSTTDKTLWRREAKKTVSYSRIISYRIRSQRKSNKKARKPKWINQEILAKLEHKKEDYRG